MTIDDLREAVRGSVIAVDSANFAAASQSLLFNARKPARQPRIIVQAADVADVQATVRFARAKGLRVSPRGGGHNWSGIAQQADIVLDLGALRSLRIDAGMRMAEAGPAVTNRMLAEALERKGLAFPAGHCADVPLSGYLLGGGFGWNSGAWGIACFNVESLDVVTADGELRRASAHEHPDIFWAARGAGPEFFGVVVSYRLRLQPLPRAITTSMRTYPLDDIDAVTRWVKAAMASGPANVEFTVALTTAPEPLAGRSPKTASAIATVFANSRAEARATLSRIAAMAPAGALDVHEEMPTPFGVLYDITGGFFPQGRRYAVDSFWTADEDLFAGMARAVAKAPSRETFALGVIGPAHPPALPDAAFSKIAPVFGCAYAIWDDAAADAGNIAWLRELAQDVAPLTLGHYVGEADLELPQRLENCFSAEARARLKALQAQYDPAGTFRRPLPSDLPRSQAKAKRAAA